MLASPILEDVNNQIALDLWSKPGDERIEQESKSSWGRESTNQWS